MADAVLVTGATGLIGAALVRYFSAREGHVFAAVRSVDRARMMFDGMPGVEVLEWDVLYPASDAVAKAVRSYDLSVVHAAGETSSRAFVENPEGVRQVTVKGTEHVLQLAGVAHVESLVYLSTFEVLLGLKGVRASYPNAKLEAERLCRESGVNVKIARLAQTFGAGVRPDDGRVFAEFARAIVEKRNIVLKTAGTTARCYCHLDDAVEAIALLLRAGERNGVYVVADEASYCTIREMAEHLIADHPESGTRLVIDESGVDARGFAPPFQLKLDAGPLRALGWHPRRSLTSAFEDMMASWKVQAFDSHLWHE